MIRICATCKFWVFRHFNEERGQVGICQREPAVSYSWHSCKDHIYGDKPREQPETTDGHREPA